MGNTLIRGHGLHISGWRRRVDGLSSLVLVQGSGGIEAGEEDRPIVQGMPTGILALGDTDRLADERLAQKDVVASPFDLAILADAPDLVASRIVGLAPAAVVAARARLVMLRWGIL